MQPDTLDAHIDDLLSRSIDNNSKLQRNPVTGGTWVRGLDSVRSQKQKARGALLAAALYEASAPPEVPKLPLTYGEREALKGDFGLGYVVALYARSLECRNYRTLGHPDFHDYTCAVLTTKIGARILVANPHLADRYPPKRIPEIDESGYFNG
jgi:hypothetical protein